MLPSERGCMIENTTPWLSYASWTWEVLRRNPDYISYYHALKNKGLTEILANGACPLVKSSRRFPTANKFGLVAPADPSKYAGDAQVFWHPDVFESVVRFHIIDPNDVKRDLKPVQLSQFSGEKAHFLDAEGTYHIRIMGERFWFQIQCAGITSVPEEAYIGLEMNHLKNPDKRLKIFKEIGGVYDGSLALDSRLHVPARLEYHQRSTLAYDIRERGGTILDVVNAFIKAGLVAEDPDKYVDFKDVAQNAYRAGKAYIYGDYLKILNRQ